MDLRKECAINDAALEAWVRGLLLLRRFTACDFTVVSRACIRLHALPHQSEDDQSLIALAQT